MYNKQPLDMSVVGIKKLGRYLNNFRKSQCGSSQKLALVKDCQKHSIMKDRCW